MKSKVLNKITSSILIIILCLTFLPNFSIGAEKTETLNGVTATLSNDGTLIVSGEGVLSRQLIMKFNYQSEIKSVVIQEGITSIGERAFDLCYELTSVEIPKTVTKIGIEAFEFCTKLENISISNGLKEIGNSAFNSCYKLKTLRLPESVTSIGEGAFWACKELTDINIPNITTINSYTFQECKKLKSITLNDGIQQINSGAFVDCESLERITLPKNLKNIGQAVFRECYSLKEINIDNSNEHFTCEQGELFTKTKEYLVCCPADKDDYIIPSEVKYIWHTAFSNCNNLTNIIIPENVEVIGNSAFEYCKNLKSIQIPNSVKSLGSNAFNGCNSLENIVIPGSIEKVATSTFYNCKSLKNVTLENCVKNIDTYAFQYCTSLENVTFGNNITNIEIEAFMGCSNLNNLVIPKSVNLINYRAFSGCSKLDNIKILSDNIKIEGNPFQGCSSNLTIYGHANSSAQTFATENNYRFEVIEKDTQEYYYSSLEKAIKDANSETFEYADSDLENGFVSVKKEDDKIVVTLLKDYTEQNELIIDNDMDFDLNGKKLSLRTSSTEDANIIKINKTKTLNVIGTTEGSEINFERTEENNINVFLVGGNLNINGGKYTNISTEEEIEGLNCNFIRVEDTSVHMVNLENTEIHMDNFANQISILTNEKLNNSTTNINNSKIYLSNSTETTEVYKGNGIINVKNNEIKIHQKRGMGCAIATAKYGLINSLNNNYEIIADSEYIYGIFTRGIAYIENDTLKIVNRALKAGVIYGIMGYDSIEVTVKDTNLTVDSPTNNKINNADPYTNTIGIYVNSGILKIENGNLLINDLCVSVYNSAKLYVNGGTYQAYGHGAFYLANGYGENYIENANLIHLDKTEYNGEFDTDNWMDISSCLYMGGGNYEWTSGVRGHLNNCHFIDHNSRSGFFTLRDSSGEKDLSIYISNTIFEATGRPNFYRIDDPSDHAYFGTGNQLNGAHLQEDGKTAYEEVVDETDEVYARIKKGYLEAGNTKFKNVYIKGEKFDRTGLEINLVDENGTEKITDYEILNEQEELTEENKYITVKYNELELEIPIFVFSDEYVYITCSIDVYNTMDDLINDITYLKVNNDSVSCVIKKDTISNFTSDNFSWNQENEKPTVVITGDTLDETGNKTTSNTVTYTFTWGENIYEFNKDSIIVENGEKGKFVEVIPNKVYTLVVTNNVAQGETGTQKIVINPNECVDSSSNGNERVEKEIQIDRTQVNSENQNGENQNGENQNGENQNGENQNGENQNGENQNGENQNGENQNGENQNGENQNQENTKEETQSGQNQTTQKNNETIKTYNTKNTSSSTDTTVINKKIDNAGLSFEIVSIITGIAIFGVIAYIKFVKYDKMK